MVIPRTALQGRCQSGSNALYSPDPCQQAPGDRCGQCLLPMVNVTNRSDVLLRFITLKISLGHRLVPLLCTLVA